MPLFAPSYPGSTTVFFPRFLLETALLGLLSTPDAITAWLTPALAETVHRIYSVCAPVADVQVVGAYLINTESLNYLHVGDQCTGLGLLAVVCAYALAVPRAGRDKLIILAASVLIIEGINLARLTHLFHWIQRDYQAFESLHDYGWPLIVFAAALSCLWIATPWTGRQRILADLSLTRSWRSLAGRLAVLLASSALLM